MAQKKNRVSIFGKTFHVTPAGKILPLGRKNNRFTRCMRREVKGKMNMGTNLTEEELLQNKRTWQVGLGVCADGYVATPLTIRRK